MSHLSRLALAGGLALVTAVLNGLYLASQVQPAMFVAIAVDLDEGEEISEDHVRAVGIPGDPSRLRQSLIPYSERNTIIGLPASRTYLQGDVVFYRDLKPPQEQTRWEVIGPFRLISVNERSGLSDSSFETSGNSITVAVNADFEGHTQRLLELFGNEDDRDQDDQTITAVQVVPPEANGQRPQRFANEVIQTIKLNGGVQLPPVLVKGDLIRFVVKDELQY